MLRGEAKDTNPSRARRRVTLRLLPYVFLLYVIAYLDRINLATAALQMQRDLGFVEAVLWHVEFQHDYRVQINPLPAHSHV